MQNKSKMSRRSFLKSTGTALALGAPLGMQLTSCLGAEPEGQWTILVTIDTQRPDHLGCYGYVRDTSPFLDELARGGVRFKNCFAHCGTTYPSHTTLFTSLEPEQHGILANRSAQLAPEFWTVAEMFEDLGYETAAFVSLGMGILERLKQGFQTFDSTVIEERGYRWAEDTVEAAIEWLSTKTSSNKIFLWVHIFDPHEWMTDGEPQSKTLQVSSSDEKASLLNYWTQNQRKFMDTGKPPLQGDPEVFFEKHNNYDSRTRYTDDVLRRLHAYTSEHGPKTDTLWMVTADHGESLGNHHYDQHAKHLYNEVIRVPLIVNFSNGDFANTVVEEATSHVDVFPTLADMLGQTMHRQFLPAQGQSLLPLLCTEQGYEQRNIFGQRQIKHPDYKAAQTWIDDAVYCLHNLDYKYIVNEASQDEFFDLREDPFELDNLIDRHSAVKDAMKEEAIERMLRFRADVSKRKIDSISPELEEALNALGYI